MEKERKGLEVLDTLKGSLPPIQTEYKIEIRSLAELKEKNEEAEKRKNQAQEFAEQEVKIRATLKLYKNQVPNWDQLSKTDDFRKEIESLQERLEKLVHLGGDIGEGKEFSKMVIEIRLTDEFGPAKKMMKRLIEQEKRFRIASRDEVRDYKAQHKGKFPHGAQFLDGIIYFPFELKNREEKSPGQRCLEEAVREMNQRATDSKITRMQGVGDHDLTGLLPGEGIPGKYYLHSEAPEGHIIVEIYDDNKGALNRKPFMKVRIEDAFMNTSSMMEGRRVFPFKWMEKGWIPQNADLSTEEKKNVGKKINDLRNIIGAWRATHKQIETPAPKATEPALISREAPSTDDDASLAALTDAIEAQLSGENNS